MIRTALKLNRNAAVFVATLHEAVEALTTFYVHATVHGEGDKRIDG